VPSLSRGVRRRSACRQASPLRSTQGSHPLCSARVVPRHVMPRRSSTARSVGVACGKTSGDASCRTRRGAPKHWQAIYETVALDGSPPSVASCPARFRPSPGGRHGVPRGRPSMRRRLSRLRPRHFARDLGSSSPAEHRPRFPGDKVRFFDGEQTLSKTHVAVISGVIRGVGGDAAAWRNLPVIDGAER
jgi:hypothetical protein